MISIVKTIAWIVCFIAICGAGGNLSGAPVTLLQDLGSEEAPSYSRILESRPNGMVYFTTSRMSYGEELWSTNGTSEGTELIKNVTSNSTMLPPLADLPTEPVFYFSSFPGYSQNGTLWRSDGTVAGTLPIKRLVGGPYSIARMGQKCVFTASDDSHGLELWGSDGTTAGTYLIKDVYAGLASGVSHTSITSFGDSVVFGGLTAQGFGFWKSDGTENGTWLVRGDASRTFSPSNFTEMNGVLYFSAYGGFNGRELWQSDGTAAGTALVKVIASAAVRGGMGDFRTMDGMLYFAAFSAESVGMQELWKSDGSCAGTVLVRALGPQANLQGLTPAGHLIFFTATTPLQGNELWGSDGTSIGTRLVKDIYPGPDGAHPDSIIAIGNEVYFTADDGVHGQELWKSDGSTAGTVLVTDITGDAGSSFPTNLQRMGTKLLFTANAVAGNSALFACETTGPSTQMQPATSVTSSSAVLNGSAAATGSILEAHFEYGTTFAYGQSASVPPPQLRAGFQAVSVAISGLIPNTRYYYRLSASDATGTVCSEEGSFVTVSAELEAWRERYFGSPANHGQGANLEDADQDGLVNLVEYAFGLDPTKASPNAFPQGEVRGLHFLISLLHPEGVVGVRYTAEWSVDLLNWNAVPDTGDSAVHVFAVPTNGNKRLAVRLLVDTP
jgi:ELWxxDGT repeat protein